ncbi:MAG: Crp/Fnr family transcriptional regulator [Pseudomonadota bacterium]
MTVHDSLLALMPRRLLAELKAIGARRHFADGQVIHTQQTMSVGLSIVLHGRVCFGLYTESGDYYLTAILGAGHCFGEATLFADRPRAYHADAFGDTEILSLTQRQFDHLYKREPRFSRAVTATVTQRLYEALDFSDDLRHRSVEQQIVRLLSRVQRLGGFGDGVLPMRQQDLVFSLGVSRARVCQALDRLRAAGVLETRYRTIVMLASVNG